MILALQILLVLSLPVWSNSSFDSGSTKEHLDVECNGHGEFADTRTVKDFPRELSTGLNLEMTRGVSENEEPYNKMRRRPKPGAHKSATCYRNIRLVMTEKCSRFQLIDFSDVKISDFCIGGHVHLGGSITIFKTIRHPFSIVTNITRVEKLREKTGKEEVARSRGRGNNVHIFATNGCNLFQAFLCSRRRSPWCGCPIPWGKAPLFWASMHATADFVPKRLGAGKFVGKSEFEFPGGRSCLEFTFDKFVKHFDF